MLDVRWDVLVVRIRAGECRIVWVWLRIVPVELLIALPDLVAIADNRTCGAGERQFFAHDQTVPRG